MKRRRCRSAVRIAAAADRQRQAESSIVCKRSGLAPTICVNLQPWTTSRGRLQRGVIEVGAYDSHRFLKRQNNLQFNNMPCGPVSIYFPHTHRRRTCSNRALASAMDWSSPGLPVVPMAIPIHAIRKIEMLTSMVQPGSQLIRPAPKSVTETRRASRPKIHHRRSVRDVRVW